MEKVGIIGFGHMGSAFALGLKDRGIHAAISEKRADAAEAARKEHGLEVAESPSELARSADPIIVAVKPQDAEELGREIGGGLREKRVISIMAGRSMAYLKRVLKPGQLARFMPNLAARHQKAVVAVAFESDADRGFREDCFTIAGAVGSCFEIPEKLMPAFTGLSASGIAYVFAFFHALALAGVKQGFAYPDALRIGAGTVDSALTLLRESGENPVEWLARVISPAGTTIQGVSALEELGFTHGVIQAVERAAARAQELES